MSAVSFVHENDNPFPTELILGLFSFVKKKNPHIYKLDDRDWKCFPRPKYSVFLYKILLYSMNESVILDYEL